MFIGNAIVYNKLCKWIKTPIKQGSLLNYDNVCIVHGISGVGKTYGIIKAIEECGKVCVSYNIELKDIKTNVTKIVTSDILSQFTNVKLSDKILFIDELETLLAIDRSFMVSLCQLFETIPAIKIIIASITFDTKFAGKILDFKIPVPSEQEIILFLKQTFPELTSQDLLDISYNCNGNLSIAKNLANTKFTSKHDNTLNVIDIYTNKNIEHICNIIQIDTWLIPLRYHENSIYDFKNRKGKTEVKFLEYLEFMKGLICWDILMSYCKTSFMNDMIPTYMIALHINKLNKIERKKIGTTEQMDNFTKLFNNLSLRKKRRVLSYESVFPWSNVSGFYKEIVGTIKTTRGSRTKKLFSED